MDFLGSYIPPCSTKFTPRSNGVKFDELPAPHAPCDGTQLENMKNGKFDQVRQLRKDFEKRKTTVRFIAPISEDDESLQSIALTPSIRPAPPPQPSPWPVATHAKASQSDATVKKRSGHRNKEKSGIIFGFKFRKTSSK